MRNLLATAVALAPLMAAAGAQAEVVISTARTTPIITSTAGANGGADTIRIANGGSIALTSGVAVTINSSHSVTTDTGSNITMENAADNAVGILVNGGNTANVTLGGGISITDNINGGDDLDTDNDGDADGPLASGTGRYGLRLTGAGPLTGNVNLQGSSGITVEGNNSYGVSLESGIVGNVSTAGSIRTTGTNSVGLNIAGPVTGSVRVGGTIAARGENATGVNLSGDVTGRLTLQGNISASGYRYTESPIERPEGFTETAENDDDYLFLDELDADDLLQGGPTVRIASNVGGGVVLDVGPTYGAGGVEGDDDGDGVKNGDEDDDGDGVKNSTDTDRDGDGVIDTSEGVSSIASFGGAPALVVASADRSITLSVAGTGQDAYGFINRGSISVGGIYHGIATNAATFGGAAGQTVTVAGGIRNDGAISSAAGTANTTALRLAEGLITPQLLNNGTISAASDTEIASLTTAVSIEAGANVPSLVNNGEISAAAFGGTATVTALIDASGSLTSITNTGVIGARLTANEDGDPLTGSTRAIDVTANTSGVTLIQNGTPSNNDDLVDSDDDGVADQDEPSIEGDVRFGSGADVMDIRNGTVSGAISFGAGADRLLISGGAEVRGALSDADGLLDITVANGVLDARQAGQVNVTSLNVGSAGDLIVSLDPAGTSSAAGFRVNGTATLADGAGLGVRFNSLLTEAERFTVIDADTLVTGAIDQSQLQSNSPYLYVVSAGTDIAAADVYVDVRRRTAAEAQLMGVETAAFESVYGALAESEAIRNAFLSQTDREGFINLYEQMLPDHSGGPLLSLASGVDAVTRALTGRNASAAPGESSAWVQEINFYADKDRTDTYGFRSEGFGVAGGVERGTSLGAVGVSLAFTSSDLEDPEAEAEEVLSANLVELGLYWRAQGQYWTTWARAAAGYASFDATRTLVDGEGLNLSNESTWHGMTLALAGGASYERHFGKLNVRPEVYGEYFGLSEDARAEEGGGDGFDLEIDERDGHMFSATAAMNIGYGFGENGWLRPELRIGWKQNISVDAGDTIARFASGGPDFTLAGGSIEGGGPILGFRLNVGNELGMLSISADAEMIEDYIRYALLLRASFRF